MAVLGVGLLLLDLCGFAFKCFRVDIIAVDLLYVWHRFCLIGCCWVLRLDLR